MKTQNFNVPVTIMTTETQIAPDRSVWTYQLKIFGVLFGSGIEAYTSEASAIRAAERQIRASASNLKELAG